jgi:dTDP-4-dehydrorhamnose 3,5-epimerase
VSLRFISLPIEGLFLVEPRVFTDDRGFFFESYRASDFASQGIRVDFVQDNHSLSAAGVVRGLHFQRAPHQQAKLVRVVAGSVWDVVVDLRPGSASFGQWYGLELAVANYRMLYIPEGFAHGFVALSEGAELLYKCSREYRQESEGGVRWNDPDLGIQWPVRNVRVSARDASLPPLKDLQ